MIYFTINKTIIFITETKKCFSILQRITDKICRKDPSNIRNYSNVLVCFLLKMSLF